jgi:acyl-coenzyme A thioesterase PaaI-like protein
VHAVIHIQEHHCNPTWDINGGVIISLADNIATGAAGAPTTKSLANKLSWSVWTFMP